MNGVEREKLKLNKKNLKLNKMMITCHELKSLINSITGTRVQNI